jgi:predicted nucleic acid-binding protein
MADPAYLADTNILLRLSQSQDPHYESIRLALHSLRASGARFCFTSQNLAEFWNVCTRPVAQNGYGLTVAETDRRAQLVEASFTLLPDNGEVHVQWRKLIVIHSVSGVQVHDERLVAAMRSCVCWPKRIDSGQTTPLPLTAKMGFTEGKNAPRYWPATAMG